MGEKPWREISCGAWRARILPSCGGLCIGIENGEYGALLLRQAEDPKRPDNPYLYGMPLLFPVNRIRDGVFSFEGRAYRFPINEEKTGCHLHGNMREREFQILSHTASRLVCAYEAKEGEYLGFPHAFRVILDYRVGEDGFQLKTRFRNDSRENMPLFFGFHTSFSLKLCEKSDPKKTRVFASLGEEYERDSQRFLSTGRRLPADEITEALKRGEFCPENRGISRHYRAAGDGRMGLWDPENSLMMIYENSPELAFRLLFQPEGKDFICLEPQTSLVDGVNAPLSPQEAGILSLKPGEEREFYSRIRLKKIHGTAPMENC